MTGCSPISNIKKWHLFVLIGMVSLFLVVSSILYYSVEEKSIRHGEYREIKAIALLKINEIAKCYMDELLDAQIIARNYFLDEKITVWIKNPSTKNKLQLQKFLNTIVIEHEQRLIIIADLKEDFLAANHYSVNIIDPYLPKLIKYAVAKAITITSNIYSCQNYSRDCIDFISPIYKQNKEPVVVIIFKMEPNDFLFPLVQSRPTPCGTDEIMFVRRDIDSVKFLSTRKWQQKGQKELCLPLSHKELSTVKGALGFKGIVEGKNYFGKYCDLNNFLLTVQS